MHTAAPRKTHPCAAHMLLPLLLLSCWILGVQSAAVRLPIKVAGHQQCRGIGTNTSFAIDNYWVATCVEADVLLPAAAAHLVADIRPIQVGVFVVFTQVGTMVITVQQLVCLQRRACNAQHQFS